MEASPNEFTARPLISQKKLWRLLSIVLWMLAVGPIIAILSPLLSQKASFQAAQIVSLL